MADDNDSDLNRKHTIVTTDGDGRGNAAIILLVALVAILLAVLFFGGVFDRNDESDLNVDVNAPPDINVNVPATQVPPPVIIAPDTQAPPPDVNINVVTPPPEENLNDVEGVTINSG